MHGYDLAVTAPAGRSADIPVPASIPRCLRGLAARVGEGPVPAERTLHAALAGVTGPARAADRLPCLGYWPAAFVLLCFVWLELVPPGRAEPRTVGVFLVLCGVAQLVGGLWFGAGWFARADAFEVYSLLGRLSPFGRRSDGRVVRSPLDGVDGLRPERVSSPSSWS